MAYSTSKISYYSNAYTTKASKEITIDEYFKGIVNGKWQDEIFKYKSGKQKKEQLAAVTISGTFKEGRKDSDIKSYTNLLIVDVDQKDNSVNLIEIKERLKEIPQLFAYHHSVSGQGLALYFPVNKTKYKESYEAITQMLANDYGIICDASCSNISRLRFISYDPDLYVNYGAEKWTSYIEKENQFTPKNYDSLVFSENDIDYILQQIKDKHINIAPDYYAWVRIGFAFASHFGERGREYFNFISSFHYGQQKISPDKQYDICLKSNNHRSGVTIKSFFHYAKIAGCDLVSKRTKTIANIARLRRKQESVNTSGKIIDGKKSAKEHLTLIEGIEGDDVDEVIDQIWNLPVKDLKENETTLIEEIELFLKSNYKIKFNNITKVVEIDGEPITDYKFNSIYLQASRIVSEKVGKEKVYDLLHSDFTPKYNPILEWFEQNKNQNIPDGNILKLASCINSPMDAKHVHYFFRKWLLSLIASAHGTYSILCLVLTGKEQGTGKTKFFRLLLPDELQSFYAQSKLEGKEADVAKLMCIKWIICDDEFGGKNKQDEKKFKELISTDIFSVRSPYGRYIEDLKRLSVLAGTTNEEEILNDITGNRRIIPIPVNSIDHDKYKSINKDHLFIELYNEYIKNKDEFMLTSEDINLLESLTLENQVRMPEIELTNKYFRPCAVNDANGKFLSSSEIRSYIEKLSGIRISQQKLSIALKKEHFIFEIKKVDGKAKRGFHVIQKYDDQNNDFYTNYDERIESKKDDIDKLPF